MITKKIKHNNIEICKICNKEINTSTDEWVAVVESTKFNHFL